MKNSRLIEIGKRIKHIRKDKKLNQDAFGKKIGRDGSTISKLESGELELSNLIQLAIHNVFAVRDEWLLTGEEPIYDDRWKLLEDRAKELGEDVYIKLKIAEREKDRYGELMQDIIKDDQAGYGMGTEGRYVYVPQVSGKISAGMGRVPEEDEEVRVAFRREWIRRKGDARDMVLIKVAGDSMEPTLLAGDLVMVDRGRNYFDPQGGIYAIALDDIIMVKRIQILDDQVRIISDNKKYEVFEVPADRVKINGKVIWFARELER